MFSIKNLSKWAERLTNVYRPVFNYQKVNYKVAILGAAGHIGQALAMLMKLNPLVTDLTLQDDNPAMPGLAIDVSHINTCPNRVVGYTSDQLHFSLYGTTLVLLLAGRPRSKETKCRDELLNCNANIVFELTCAIAKCCPAAIIAIVTNPINSCVPIASEVMKKSGLYDPRRIFGVTTLDLIRASTFVSEYNCTDPLGQYVPVIGGHSEGSIIPLLSQSVPHVYLSDRDTESVTNRIQFANKEVAKASGGTSASLSTAFATARFADSILRGLSGEPDVIECAYVRSNETDATYFSTPLVLGLSGVEKNLGIGPMTPFEENLMNRALPVLRENISKGEAIAAKKLGELNLK